MNFINRYLVKFQIEQVTEIYVYANTEAEAIQKGKEGEGLYGGEQAGRLPDGKHCAVILLQENVNEDD